MADTIMAMLMASASVEINIIVPFSFNLALLTHPTAIWFHTFFIAALYGENKPAKFWRSRFKKHRDTTSAPKAGGWRSLSKRQLRRMSRQVAHFSGSRLRRT
ncbi:hypothetical protein [Hoeflea sp.]|uniref:hypothetical protein n=1 Tax=Hoeflea sp. TaxID=1940281 RepID=UPI003BAFD9A7